jgi:signal peptidase I
MGWIIFIVATIGWHIGMYGMFKKAGIDAWKAFVPFYNTWCMVEKMNLKKYWFFLQFIPIAGQFITIWITIKFVEHFGRFGVLQHTLTVFLPFIYFPYLGFSKNERYAGEAVVKNYKKSATREWIDAAAFAVVAATLIRTFVFEAYTIPTPSEEKTLLVNDFLFVSKWAYGPRIPNTPVAMPFVHHTIPFVNAKAYSEAVQIPYTRWFASPVTRNDAMVFNFPENDTLINDEINFGSRITYYTAIRGVMAELKVNEQQARNFLDQRYGDIIVTRPVDKRENFIKRCVAIAGDSIKIINGQVFINNARQDFFPHSERYYKVKNPAAFSVDADSLLALGIHANANPEINDIVTPSVQNPNGPTLVNITNEEWAALPQNVKDNFEYFIQQPDPGVFPYYDTSKGWSADNFGQMWVPSKGGIVQLNADTYIRYQRCIRTYENNKFEMVGDKFYLNGKEVTTYTFKMNYFFLMGDNRHNSLDSRYWGFVPEDHVVGKASLIWFSWEKGPRWNRLFKTIK